MIIFSLTVFFSVKISSFSYFFPPWCLLSWSVQAGTADSAVPYSAVAVTTAQSLEQSPAWPPSSLSATYFPGLGPALSSVTNNFIVTIFRDLTLAGCTILQRNHTYSMEQSPSWEANWFSASQEIQHFRESEGSLPHLQEPATCPSSWAKLILSMLPHLISWRPI
jgi:hypothetical protein